MQTICFAVRFVAVVLLAIPTLVHAEAAKPSAVAQPGVSSLTAGELQAQLSDSRQAAPSAAGSFGFVSISLTVGKPEETPATDRRKKRRDTAKGSISATLRVEASGGELKAISGSNVAAEIQPNRGSATLTGLRHGATYTILAEMLLKPGAPGDKNILKLTLEDMNGVASAPVELAWQVRDCAGDFYRELRTISEQGGGTAAKRLSEVRSADQSIPDGFIFKAFSRPSQAQSGCIRYRRKWDPYAYQWQRVCTRYRKGSPDTDTTASTGGGTETTKEERELYDRAVTFLRSKGADRRLGRSGDLGWITGKVADDMRIYLSQDQHPALCTGAIQYTDYYSKKTAGLRNYLTGFKTAADRAVTLAVRKVEEAKAAIGTSAPPVAQAATPIAASLDSAQAGTGPIRKLILDLASQAQLSTASVAESLDDLALLRSLRRELDAKAEDDAGRELANTLIPAFSAAEAALYLAMADNRYEALRTGLIGSVDRIRAAHDRSCVCGP